MSISLVVGAVTLAILGLIAQAKRPKKKAVLVKGRQKK